MMEFEGRTEDYAWRKKPKKMFFQFNDCLYLFAGFFYLCGELSIGSFFSLIRCVSVVSFSSQFHHATTKNITVLGGFSWKKQSSTDPLTFKGNFFEGSVGKIIRCIGQRIPSPNRFSSFRKMGGSSLFCIE